MAPGHHDRVDLKVEAQLRSRRMVVVALFVAGLALSNGPCAAQDLAAEQLFEQVAESALQIDSAVQISTLRLKTGPAVIYLQGGTIFPASALAGRPAEFVYLGKGRLEIAPEDQIERDQLELFTGSASLDENFTQAVFVVAFDRAADALLGQAETAASAQDADLATELYRQWRAGPERRLLDIKARLVRDALGDPLGKGFFCGSFEGSELGRFLFVVDPMAEEQVTLGQFVQPTLSKKQRRKVKRGLHRSQLKGKLIGLEVSDLGQWDTWMSKTMISRDGKPTRGTSGIEPQHYSLDVTLAGRALDLSATATIRIEALVDGLRAVTLALSQSLAVTEVRSSAGQRLPHLQTPGELLVVLDEPVVGGQVFELAIDYSGKPIEKVASKAYAMSDALSWYPHAGQLDLATYDATFRWPKRLDLLASGAVVAEGEDRDGQRWQSRRLDTRSAGISFEIGSFDLMTRQVGHVKVTVAIDKLGRKVDRDLAEEVMESVEGSLSYFEEAFGAYPLDYLTVVSSPKPLSQGLLGFLTLSTIGVIDWDIMGAAIGILDRRTLIAHEIAHQWWGNMVGWRGYRDQWISEAMANYSALLYSRNRLAEGDEQKVRRGPTTGWMRALLRTTDDGRPIESLGPVVLGARLDSSISGAAYEAIVYKKGAVILDMLARAFSEEGFIEMLRRIVEITRGNVVSTEDFIMLLEKIGGADLDWFANQYIYGTGLPKIYYKYEIKKTGDSTWVVFGEARQQAPYHYEYRLEKTANGSYDIRRQAIARLDVSSSGLVVPFQIGIKDVDSAAAELEKDRKNSEADARPGILNGRVLLTGESSPFSFEIENEPEILFFDGHREVFGWFFCESRWPQRMAYFAGLNQMASGSFAGAEQALRRALTVEATPLPENWKHLEGHSEYEARVMDSLIRFALIRLYLDHGRIDEAAHEYKALEDSFRRSDRLRFREALAVFAARIDLAQGDSLRAYSVLRKTFHGRKAIDSPEGYALLAVAAYLTDHDEVYGKARTRALDRGVDLGELDSD